MCNTRWMQVNWGQQWHYQKKYDCLISMPGLNMGYWRLEASTTMELNSASTAMELYSALNDSSNIPQSSSIFPTHWHNFCCPSETVTALHLRECYPFLQSQNMDSPIKTANTYYKMISNWINVNILEHPALATSIEQNHGGPHPDLQKGSKSQNQLKQKINNF